MLKFNYKKAVQSLNFFAIKENGKITKMKAIKLIWLSDRLHLRNYGRLIISDIYFALPKGPVPSHTKNLAEANNTFIVEIEKQYKNRYIKSENNNFSYSSINKFDKSVFSKTDVAVMEKVYAEFKDYNQYQLSELSHDFPEWKKHESSFDAGGTRFDIK